jgi:hypothetical protein
LRLLLNGPDAFDGCRSIYLNSRARVHANTGTGSNAHLRLITNSDADADLCKGRGRRKRECKDSYDGFSDVHRGVLLD